MAEDSVLDAGDFSPWIVDIVGAIRGEHGSDVPCGTCTACCTSQQFVHIGPDEADTLDHVPPELLFPAPGLPRGHVLLGYDERGHCPMLVEGQCSIYDHRPRTCRTYDCRIFPASGVELDDEGKAGIAERARRWRFREPAEADRLRHAAVRAAATFLAEHAGDFPAGTVPPNPTQRAVLAVEVHHLFLRAGGSGGFEVVEPRLAAVEEVLLSPPPNLSLI